MTKHRCEGTTGDSNDAPVRGPRAYIQAWRPPADGVSHPWPPGGHVSDVYQPGAGDSRLSGLAALASTFLHTGKGLKFQARPLGQARSDLWAEARSRRRAAAGTARCGPAPAVSRGHDESGAILREVSPATFIAFYSLPENLTGRILHPARSLSGALMSRRQRAPAIGSAAAPL